MSQPADLSTLLTEARALVRQLQAERDVMLGLAKRAYPNLHATKFCSHHAEDGHYACIACYPNLPALLGEHVAIKAAVVAERDAALARVTELEATVRQLSERLASCSEALGRAAERRAGQ